MKTPIQFRLNGEDVAAFVESGANLLDVLRESVGDLSVKGGCWQGTCGTCTVLIRQVDRKRRRAAPRR
jgi:carbon-monoxide dehydrogenase small subunit